MRDVSGRSQSPELYRGKVLLLDFWATWCGPCLEEMPNLRRLYAKHHDQGFAIVGISLDSDREALKQFLQQEGITWPQICDGRGSKGELARRMGVIAEVIVWAAEARDRMRAYAMGETDQVAPGRASLPGEEDLTAYPG